jgi:hypothetical protein
MGTVFNVAIGLITVYALFIGGVILWAWLSKDNEPQDMSEEILQEIKSLNKEEIEELIEAVYVDHVYYDPKTNEIFLMDYRLESSPEVAVYLGTL